MSAPSSASSVPFKPGDRLYGLNTPRLVEQNKLESGIPHQERFAKSDVTIDRAKIGSKLRTASHPNRNPLAQPTLPSIHS